MAARSSQDRDGTDAPTAVPAAGPDAAGGAAADSDGAAGAGRTEGGAAASRSDAGGRLIGLVQLARAVAHPRHWPLALRVVVVTTLLATFAVLVVGTYLTSVIADGLYEQRRDRVLEESTELREQLIEDLSGLSSSTTTQQQDAATAFINSSSGGGSLTGRNVALVPVDTSGNVWPVSTDQTLLDAVESGRLDLGADRGTDRGADQRQGSSLSEAVDEEFTQSLAEQPDALVWRSVGLAGSSGQTEPGLLVGTRVLVPGTGSYDLYVLYSFQDEQDTLAFMQGVMTGGGAVLITLVLGIAVVVARLVTTPLQRAAQAAERMAAGDLGTRVAVSGGDELARVGLSFNDMADSLEQKIEDLTELSRVQHRFVSDVSHELRTPLTTIRMAASVLHTSRSELPSDLRRTAELLSTQVERFDVLLDDLLEISRFDAGAAVLESQRLSLVDLVERAVDNARPLAAARGCTLEVQRASMDLDAVVDDRRVDRILRNLLTNAIEHGTGAPVLVQMGSDETSVAVVVQDFGHGISPEEASRVFDRFWRADPSRARTLGGTGLGLAISVEDARLHSGWLQAWGQAGEGAVFRLTLPRRPGMELVSSPLKLERPFDRSAFDQQEATSTGQIEIAPDALPDLSSPDPEGSEGEVVLACPSAAAGDEDRSGRLPEDGSADCSEDDPEDDPAADPEDDPEEGR